jgi:lipid II:glycine glycyltransferase (peptidoglycan interpeptide bridge formation enzyme)
MGSHSPAGSRLQRWALIGGNANAIVSVCQVQLYSTEGSIVALIRRGPLWRRGRSDDTVVSAMTLIQKILSAYADRSSEIIVEPKVFCSQGYEVEARMHELGFRKSKNGMDTFVLELPEAPLEHRSNLRGNWRRHLRLAEREKMAVSIGTSAEMFRDFQVLDAEMRERKGIITDDDVVGFELAQNALSPNDKMRIFSATVAGRVEAAIVVSVLGDTADRVFGASSPEGRRVRASYLLDWVAIGWLKQNGTHSLDLGGVHARKNPGVYHYKAGLGGRPEQFVGTFRRCGDW